MTEYFDVDPGHVAGYARLCGDVAVDTDRIAGYLATETSAGHGFDGAVLALLAPIVDGYSEAAAARVQARGAALRGTDRALLNTAWTYLGVDRPDRFELMGTEHSSDPSWVERDHPGLVPYAHQPVTGELTTPDLEDAGFEKLMEEHAGDTLGTIDLIVRTVTGLVPGVAEYSITEEITNELTGNWMALKQKADALDNAADATEVAASSLDSGLPTLDTHWDGRSAASFAPYLTNLSGALRYEAPLNRVVAFAYRTVADLISMLAGQVIELISTGVELIRKYATGAASRGAQALWDLVSDGTAPWAAIQRDWEQAKGFFDRAKAVVREVHQLPEDLRALVEATENPTAAADYSLELALTELGQRENLPEGTADGLGLATDLTRQLGPEIDDLASGADEFAHAPEHGFDPGRAARSAG